MLELLGINPVKGDPSVALRPPARHPARRPALRRPAFVTLEPVPRPEPVNGPRTVPAQLTDPCVLHGRQRARPRVRRTVRDPQRGRLRAGDDRATRRRCRSRARARSQDSWSACCRSAKLSTKGGKKMPMPAIKYTLAAIPIAMQLGNSVRHGIREVAGPRLLPDPPAPRSGRRATARSRRPPSRCRSRSSPNAGPTSASHPRCRRGLARLWIMRSMRKESAESVGRRARSEAGAVDRLDLRAVSKEWEACPV